MFNKKIQLNRSVTFNLNLEDEVWVGLSRNGNDWQWLDETSLSSSSPLWSSGEPNNVRGFECATLNNATGGLSARSCTEMRRGLCEFTVEKPSEN